MVTSPAGQKTNKLIRLFLQPDFGLRSMPRHDGRGIIQGIQPLSNGLLDGFEISAPKIGAPDAAAKKSIAGQHNVVARKMKTHGSGRVTRRMQCDSRDPTDQQLLFILEPIVRQRHRHIGHAKEITLHLKHLPEVQIVVMQTQRCPCRLLHFT